MAAADAALTAQQGVRRRPRPANYIVKDVFFYGGKDRCQPETVKGERGLLDQAWHRIATTFQVEEPEALRRGHRAEGRDPTGDAR